jgi:dipeptidyl aminopeptidase/acylaminoacyl peptidase
MHDGRGDRQISGDGYAYWPLFAGNGKKLCFRVTRTGGSGQTPAELWVTDIESGRSDRLLARQLVTGYDVRGDRIVASVLEQSGASTLWFAWIDNREPPARLTDSTGDNPRFIGPHRIVYRRRSGTDSQLVSVNDDGSGEVSVAQSTPGNVVGSSSSDGQWVSISGMHGTALSGTARNQISPVLAGPNSARLRWSADGSLACLSLQFGDATAFGFGRTYVIPLAPGETLPPMPTGGFTSEGQLAALPGVQILPYGDLALGPTPEVYAFSRMTITRNLYRIPIP